MTLHPRGVNHLAISTCDMKAQLTFFADVLGCPTRALYWMHGVEGAKHGFVELSGDSYIAFVDHPDNNDDIEWGVSHAGNGGLPVTRGAMQHVALHVDSFDELLEMRDRVRSNGVQVLGPMDHGFCQSIYFAGPEGLALEIATGSDIDGEAWIDPEVTELCDISDEELVALKNPRPFERPAEPVPQPAYSPDVPHMHYEPEAARDKAMSLPDEFVWERLSETEPPVS